MNEYYINVKVDREERPDVDKVYMTFVQATQGGGGWPMSVFLTPTLKPIFGGTYFPPEDSVRMPTEIKWSIKMLDRGSKSHLPSLRYALLLDVYARLSNFVWSPRHIILKFKGYVEVSPSFPFPNALSMQKSSPLHGIGF